MIPESWTPYRRADDDELIGYLRPEGDLVVPVTLFGLPLGPASDRYDAEQELEARGLSYLADRWALRTDDGGERRVVIVECTPQRMVVADADFANIVGSIDIGERTRLPVPTDRLRRV